MNSQSKLISVIVPVFNEEEVLPLFYTQIKETLNRIEEQQKYRFEIIFTDNCSTDKSFEIIEGFASSDQRIKAFKLSRNFGYQRSIYYGYTQANGLAAIQIDADLQDPLELILPFLKRWEDGYKFVYGVRRSRQEGFFISLIRRVFYRLLNKISDVEIPIDAGEFRLIDRKIIDVLILIQDHQPYLRGLIASIGYKQCGIPYDRIKRQAGISKFSVFSLFSLAFDAITTYSTAPLRMMSIFGFFLSMFSIITFIIYIFSSFYYRGTWPTGFTTLALLILINLGVISLFLGIIGEYVGKTLKQSKNEPIALVQKEI
jgi:polyisoprenyl-phosphate glycosyltransferase